MKLRNIFMAFAFSGMIAAMGTMLFPSFGVKALDPISTKAYISGTIGNTTVESADNATIGSTVADIDGDAQYEAEWVVTDSGAAGLTSYIALSIPNATSDRYPELWVNITEVYIDGVKIDYSMSTNAVNTAYYEAGKDPETRVYLFDSVKGTNVSDIPQNMAITESLKVIFTVRGTGQYGNSNVDTSLLETEEPTTTDSYDSDIETTTTEYDPFYETEVTTTIAEEESTTTGDAGVAAAAVAGLTITAGIAVLSKVKFKKKK